MSRSFLVVGFSVFGLQTARALFSAGATVLGVDHSQEVVDRYGHLVSQAICADASDERVLQAIGAFDVDVAIIALRRHFDTAVLVTHLLRRHGVKEILVQVDSENEAQAIRAVGATTSIFPERDMAERVASRMMAPGLAEQIPIGSGAGIIEIEVPAHYVGKSLMELQIRSRYDVTVIALKRSGTEAEGGSTVDLSPNPTRPLQQDESLIALGRLEALERFRSEAETGVVRPNHS